MFAALEEDDEDAGAAKGRGGFATLKGLGPTDFEMLLNALLKFLPSLRSVNWCVRSALHLSSIFFILFTVCIAGGTKRKRR